MKKKGIFLVAIMAFLLVVTGCANQSKQSSPTNKVETELYNKLSKSSRDDVQFTFKRQEGTIKGQGSIDLTINNQSNKNVKFDLGDFVYLGADSLESSKSGIKTVKADKEITIKSIFKNIDETIFSDPGLFCYKNDSFKLAYLDRKTSKSNNLSDSEFKKKYRHFMAHKDDVTTNSDSSSVDDNSDNASNDNDNSTTTNDDDKADASVDSSNDDKSNSGNAINSGEEAKALVESQQGPADESQYYTYMEGMWDTSNGKAYWVVLFQHNPDSELPMRMGAWTVYPDGTVLSGQPTDIDK
ncbi:hypothetical protein FC72_GL001035 [Companilactobacillus tucceti DSM 20183]|uniref:DUF4352 domain-containing protein n=1 Tax=Companilactobacillus tucceti DSM 20183 TaxID=1423811 RepID=A0A0R1IXC3_9LACO|nr:hypothetical protein [Companilactobacillus tucceti]KRK63904.1 hypothetical protein FC72_GL001035 [Companilactobacillus tucceti DSM 20183]